MLKWFELVLHVLSSLRGLFVSRQTGDAVFADAMQSCHLKIDGNSATSELQNLVGGRRQTGWLFSPGQVLHTLLNDEE